MVSNPVASISRKCVFLPWISSCSALGTLQWYQRNFLGLAYESKPKKIRMLRKMSLFSSIFRSRGDLSKEVKKIEEEEEEGPCTSYSHQEEDIEHGRHLDYQILSGYLVEYRYQPRAFKETLDFPHFI